MTFSKVIDTFLFTHYLRRKFAILLYRIKVTAPLIPAFMILKAAIKGISSHTALAGTPIKIGVMTMFAPIIAAVMAAVETISHQILEEL